MTFHSISTYGGGRPRLSSALLAVLALAGCGADSGPVPLTVEALPSPAGEGSGEPFVSSGGDGIWLSWLEASPAGGHDLKVARMEGAGWSEAHPVAHGDRFFVNWADFPSVTPQADGTLWAHWLQRGEAGGYDYGVRLARSVDGGATWSAPWTPHEDGTPTEHGFLSAFPLEGGMGFVWLDGRNFAARPDGSEPSREMTLRFRSVDGTAAPGPEVLVDGRICDCCQTDAALTSAGPVVVYRNRTEDEIRDIYVTRRVDGAWTEGVPVHEDGWEIGGCPVNGPGVAARGREVAVAWFTGAGGVPRVNVAFSHDGGETFGAPVQVDDGDPGGRVDVLLEPDGSALVSWLERLGGDAAEVRVRRVTVAGVREPALTVTASSAARASGFPRMARAPSGDVVLAWTDTDSDRVRVAALRRGES